jgi:hypothetical protein
LRSNQGPAQEVSGCPERRRTRIRVEVRKRNVFKKKKKNLISKNRTVMQNKYSNVLLM